MFLVATEPWIVFAVCAGFVVDDFESGVIAVVSWRVVDAVDEPGERYPVWERESAYREFRAVHVHGGWIFNVEVAEGEGVHLFAPCLLLLRVDGECVVRFPVLVCGERGDFGEPLACALCWWQGVERFECCVCRSAEFFRCEWVDGFRDGVLAHPRCGALVELLCCGHG